MKEGKKYMEKLRFEELSLSKEVRKAIADMGFEEASPIQTKAIPVALEGKDILGQAQTGTGKTAAFGIPVVERVDSKLKKTQAIVLCPTRELAIQVSEELSKLAKHKRGVYIVPVYGGQPIDRQIRALKKGAQIVIGTPGRVLDHISRKTLLLDNLNMIVLDEADEMLDMGFREDIESVLKGTPEDRQTLLFSATMPKQILEITKTYQKEPVHIKIAHKQLTVPNIEQSYLRVKSENKVEVLSRLLDVYNPKLSMVFCNTKRMVDEVVAHLQARGYFADGLHGDMKQTQRDIVMDKFRKGTIEILVATDVAARGIDVEDIEAVFNYDFPQDDEYYVHRIGRTGRAGRTGKSFTFVYGRDIHKLRDLEKYTKSPMKEETVPKLEDVEGTKVKAFFETLKQEAGSQDLEKYESWIKEMTDQGQDLIRVAAALLRLQVNLDLNEEIIQEPERQKGGRGKKAPAGNQRGAATTGRNTRGGKMARLFMNIGRKQNIQVSDIVGAIAGEAGLEGKKIGTVDMYEKFTFVEVPEKDAPKVIDALKNRKIKGNKINIEVANQKG